MADIKYYDVILSPVITEKKYERYGRKEIYILRSHRSY